MIKVLDSTSNPITTIGKYAGICYNSKDEDEANYKRGIDCLQSNHGRVTEYADVVVEISEYSNRVIRELYTHIEGVSRLQQSTRYVNMSEQFDNYFVPPSIAKDERALEAYEDTMAVIKDGYEFLLGLGIPKEDAGNLVPLGQDTKIVLKINLRALIHMFEVRTCNRAYIEFRNLMRELKSTLSEIDSEWAELCLNSFRTKCDKTGFCTEKTSCGRHLKNAEYKINQKVNPKEIKGHYHELIFDEQTLPSDHPFFFTPENIREFDHSNPKSHGKPHFHEIPTTPQGTGLILTHQGYLSNEPNPYVLNGDITKTQKVTCCTKDSLNTLSTNATTVSDAIDLMFETCGVPMPEPPKPLVKTLYNVPHIDMQYLRPFFDYLKKAYRFDVFDADGYFKDNDRLIDNFEDMVDMIGKEYHDMAMYVSENCVVTQNKPIEDISYRSDYGTIEVETTPTVTHDDSVMHDVVSSIITSNFDSINKMNQISEDLKQLGELLLEMHDVSTEDEDDDDEDGWEEEEWNSITVEGNAFEGFVECITKSFGIPMYDEEGYPRNEDALIADFSKAFQNAIESEVNWKINSVLEDFANEFANGDNPDPMPDIDVRDYPDEEEECFVDNYIVPYPANLFEDLFKKSVYTKAKQDE